VREELIAAGIWKLGDETFGPEFGEVVAERGKRIALGRRSERLDNVGMDFRCRRQRARSARERASGQSHAA
jgi:hypothetical protein